MNAANARKDELSEQLEVQKERLRAKGSQVTKMFQRKPQGAETKVDGFFVVKIIKGIQLPVGDQNGLSDPYVTVDFGEHRVLKTKTIYKTLNPEWNEEFCIPVSRTAFHITISIKDEDVVGTDHLGYVYFKPTEYIDGQLLEGEFELTKKMRSNLGHIVMSLQYFKANGMEVPEMHSPLREHSRVTMYQDAHVPEGMLPLTKLEDGSSYTHGQVWKDLYYALCNAKKFIYLTGWSVWTETVLVRDEDVEAETGYSPNLGKLLTKKAQEGVKLCALVWNEKISTSSYTGVMVTHDEETRMFFEKLELDNVKVKLATRYGSQGGVTQFWFTHHQKTVIIDSEIPGQEKRGLKGFVGGLDLCDGRYDTPEHPLYRTLQTCHKDDFHNVWQVSQEYGPREPWHDIHLMVDGPASYDLLLNFNERWHKQGAKYMENLYDQESDDELLSMEEYGKIIESSGQSWSTQMFRSIDSESADYLNGYSRELDDSIHHAYLHHIRRAKHFLYLENQYFLGSCRSWAGDQTIGCDHLIPLKIAEKIVSKILAGERFLAYIVLPMHPEGFPEDAPIQEILKWQTRTMTMMYKMIAEALDTMKSQELCHDYLKFFALGARETENGSQATGDIKAPKLSTSQKNLNTSRRYMIYVHSKLMIVDDEYIICGSANINQRSIEGNRDTEICMGAFQPDYLADEKSTPRGQVHGFRMSLWHEHLGMQHAAFKNPSSAECATIVEKEAENNWKLFAQTEPVDMKGHLLPYPHDVHPNGRITYNLKGKYFLDTKAKIEGSSKISIPNTITI